jgi:hypothetical protein
MLLYPSIYFTVLSIIIEKRMSQRSGTDISDIIMSDYSLYRFILTVYIDNE